MELQGLQEALKVEIQCHQDGELKRQLHDRQTRITALSDKQVSSVRTVSVILPCLCPAVGASLPVTSRHNNPVDVKVDGWKPPRRAAAGSAASLTPRRDSFSALKVV
uniref:Uncharacterized protein n=1 Tax=Sparus aurata TaxID=8175 RepID=A0A671WJA7_SPAAU